MDNSTVSGKFDRMKGKVKQGVGEAVGNDRMANSGTYDQVKGSAKEAWGETKDATRSSTATTNMTDRDTMDRHSTAHNLCEKIADKAEEAKEAIAGRAGRAKDRRVA